MVKLYVRRIADGKMAIGEVPELWRAEVDAAMPAEYAKRVKAGRMTLGDVPERWRDEAERLLG